MMDNDKDKHSIAQAIAGLEQYLRSPSRIEKLSKEQPKERLYSFDEVTQMLLDSTWLMQDKCNEVDPDKKLPPPERLWKVLDEEEQKTILLTFIRTCIENKELNKLIVDKLTEMKNEND